MVWGVFFNVEAYHCLYEVLAGAFAREEDAAAHAASCGGFVRRIEVR